MAGRKKVQVSFINYYFDEETHKLEWLSHLLTEKPTWRQVTAID
jgi:hypothetical protein